MNLNYKKLFTSSILLLVIYSCSRIPNKPNDSKPSETPSPITSNQPSQPNLGNPNPINSIEEIYSPILYFDSQEKQPITSVEAYLQMGISLEGKKRIGSYKVLKQNISENDLATNINPKVKIENDDYELMIQTKDQVSKYDEKVYTRKIIKDNFTYLQYWFFYSYNDIKGTGGISLIHKCGNHQADWEHISIKVNNSAFQNAKNDSDYLKAIDGIYFSQHNKGQHDDRKFKKFGDKGLSFERSHIKAFPARGTHATYFEPHTDKGYLLVSLLGMKLYDKADGKGTTFKTQGHLINLENSNWSKFGGRWGKISDDICNIAEWFSSASNDGPIGPMQQNSGIDWDKDK
ncbi:MAG: Vps62-related protein [Candidatus Sericytochromatia bacterium]